MKTLATMAVVISHPVHSPSLSTFEEDHRRPRSPSVVCNPSHGRHVSIDQPLWCHWNCPPPRPYFVDLHSRWRRSLWICPFSCRAVDSYSLFHPIYTKKSAIGRVPSQSSSHFLLRKYTENVSFRQVEGQTTDIDPRTVTVDMMPTLIGIGRTALQFLVVELIQQPSLSKVGTRSSSNSERSFLRTYVIEFIVDLSTKWKQTDRDWERQRNERLLALARRRAVNLIWLREYALDGDQSRSSDRGRLKISSLHIHEKKQQSVVVSSLSVKIRINILHVP